MIKSIKLIKDKSRQDLRYIQLHKHQIEIDSTFLGTTSVTLQIEFKIPIRHFRNHDYTWQSLDQRLIANWYAPKILILENKQLVQANQHLGIWEVNHCNKHVLLWHFNPKNANPLVQYDSNNSKHIVQAVSPKDLKTPLAILFPLYSGVEISRSKIPFTAIACFTDHCDFDTLSNLKQQRQFFKKYHIKITKGFFLNHYSKRPDTASYEIHADELTAWYNDGHELAYHSLSQSIKPLDESLNDFKNFTPPFKNVSTWIDHGFQPYNVSLYNNYEPIKTIYGKIFKKNSINVFWNYIDSGTAVNGVINQINPKQFTLKSYYKGIKHLRLKSRMPLFIKSIIFHYYNNDDSLRIYRILAKYFKTKKQKKSIRKHVEMIFNVIKILKLLIPILLFWRIKKDQVYPFAAFAPIIFNQDIAEESFTVFQTLEMVNFKMGLNPKNIDLLVNEKGLFIAHTYFSAPLNYHEGKLFGNTNEIDMQVEENFAYLSNRIINNEIWNPTLNELVAYLKKISLVSFVCNEKGELLVNDENQLAFREVL